MVSSNHIPLHLYYKLLFLVTIYSSGARDVHMAVSLINIVPHIERGNFLHVMRWYVFYLPL
jgi:hypothetical protein